MMIQLHGAGLRPGLVALVAATIMTLWTPNLFAGDTVDSVTITRIVLVFDEVDFVPAGELPEDAVTDFTGPLIMDLPVDGSPLMLDTTTVASGIYEKVHFELRPLSNPDNPDITNLTDLDPAILQGRSIYITGYVDGDTSQTFVFEDTENIEFDVQEMFEVIGGQVTTIMLEIDTENFFRTGATVWDPRDMNNFGFLRLHIRAIFEGGYRGRGPRKNPNEVKLESEIQSVTSAMGSVASIEVLGLTIIITEGTEIEDEDNNPVDDSVLVVDARVEIRGILQEDGTIVAEEIELENDEFRKIRMRGEIESIQVNAMVVESIVVLGLTINLTPMTEVENEGGDPMPAGDLLVGDRVDIKGLLEDDGTVTARRIEIEEPEDRVKLESLIQALPDGATTGTWTVAGISIIVTDETELDSGDGPFAVGDRVEIVGQFQMDGSILASEIELEEGEPKDMIRAVIQELGPAGEDGPSTFTLAGLTIVIDEETRIKIKGDSHADATVLEDDQCVQVNGNLQEDGSILACKVKVRQLPPFGRGKKQDSLAADSNALTTTTTSATSLATSTTAARGKGRKGLISFGLGGSGATAVKIAASENWSNYE